MSEANTDIRPIARNWVGVLFAIVWNSPLLLLFWNGWSAVLAQSRTSRDHLTPARGPHPR